MDGGPAANDLNLYEMVDQGGPANDRNPANMSPEEASAYFMSLRQQGRDDDEVSLVFVQQQINDFNTKLKQARAPGVGLNPADKRLKDELQSLRERLRKPTFFQEMNTAFREPLQREFLTRVYPELKRRFGFNDGHGIDSTTFDTRLQECLLEMLSARQFYTELGFLAFFKRSFFRLFAGVGCTYFEAEFAFTIASSIINNALFTATLGYADMSTIIGALNNAYQSCSKENIITFLTSLGVEPAAASQIFDKIKDFSKEQTKFVLKCLFLKRFVGGITRAEHPNAAQHPQRQRPTFFQMISNPSDLLAYLRSIGPSGVTGIAGAPQLSLSGRAITSFREIMDSVYPGITAQLNTVFPDTADDEIKMILFKLLLNLNDDSTEEDFLMKLALLKSALYGRVEDKYIDQGRRPQSFHELCTRVCPGLVGGLTQDTVERIYGPKLESSQESNMGVAGDSVKSTLSKAELSEGTISRAMSALREFPSTVADHAKKWFEGWFETPTKPDKIIIKTSFRGDATLEFMRACNAIKKRIDRKYHKSIDAVLSAFKNTVHFDEKGNLTLSGETDYDAEVKKFAVNMDLLKKIARQYEGTKQNIKENIRKLLDTFQKAAYQQADDYCQLLSSISVPFGGNSLAALNGGESVIKRITTALEVMIQSSARAIHEIEDPDDVGDSDDEGDPGLGGRSRSRKRSVSKRTRRKGVAKKQKSKKNKRQSRRKVRRASSRKSRK